MKRTNFNLILLNAVFILGLLTSNLFGGKIIHILGFTVAGAIITYPLTFLTTDIIGEIWGKREANECVKIGVIIQLGFLILGYLSLKIKPDDLSLELQNSLTMVLNQGLRMTAASMGAFICSQTLDITIFHSLKDKYRGKHKWLRNNAGTMISQFADTVIFITIAFYGVVPNLLYMITGQYIIKLLLAACDTPFFYFFTRNKKY